MRKACARRKHWRRHCAVKKIDAVFASDLRARIAPLQPLAAMHGLTLQIEPQLRERCYGAFEGLRYADIGTLYPEAYAALLAREVDYRYPAGERVAETLREFSARSVAALDALVERPPIIARSPL